MAENAAGGTGGAGEEVVVVAKVVVVVVVGGDVVGSGELHCQVQQSVLASTITTHESKKHGSQLSSYTGQSTWKPKGVQSQKNEVQFTNVI